MLDDFNNAGNDPKLTEEITGLGLKYNLLTNYTSFIAIDSVVRNKGGKQVTVKQPLPLPENVNDNSVGNYGMVMGASVNCMKSVQSVSADYEVTEQPNIEMDEIVVEKSPPMTLVEEMPSFIGGQAAMEKFISDNIVYHADAMQGTGISGTVYIEFTVKPDGRVANVIVLRGIGGGCDEEAIRVIKLMSYKWNPGKQSGKTVSAKMVLPIKFALK